jgi:hypothetical protein
MLRLPTVVTFDDASLRVVAMRNVDFSMSAHQQLWV